jgi:hypothetical protein
MFEQFGKIIIDAGHAEIRFLLEGAAKIVDPVAVISHEFHNGQDKIIGFVEGIKDFIAGDGEGPGAADASFDLDKPEFPGVSFAPAAGSVIAPVIMLISPMGKIKRPP